MRLSSFIAVVSFSLLSSLAMASDLGPREKKIKTGILPTGEFYSLYEVSCPDDSTATIASMEGRTRWCTLAGGELSCFRMAEQASYSACDYLRVAANDATPAGAD